jgi:hypothetical protein
MHALSRLMRFFIRLVLVVVGLCLSLLFLAFALTFGLIIWLWMMWRGVPVQPMQWATGRFQAARASRMWNGSPERHAGDVVDVEVVVKTEDSTAEVTRITGPTRP